MRKPKNCLCCGNDYLVNQRLNDGFCDDCREETNRGIFDEEVLVLNTEELFLELDKQEAIS